MRSLRLPSIAALTLAAVSLNAQPLAEAAKELAGKIPKGAIVTGERINGGPAVFATAGQLEPKGVPPEKVLFEIGSISKVFTGLLLAQAVTEGKVKLETTLQDLLGNKLTFADPQVAAITLKQLATHTSGLPRLPDDLLKSLAGSMSEDPYSDYGREKLLASLKTASLTGKPPFKSDYSNLGVGLLGELLAQVYARPWDELVRDKICGPLGMKDTAVHLSAEQQQRLTSGYKVGGEPAGHWFAKGGALAGAGGVRSTASDMLRLGAALVEPGKTPLKEAILLLEQPLDRTSPTTETCLCLVRSIRDGKVTFWHNGQTGGFHSMLQVAPETRTVQVALGSIADGRIDELINGTRPAPPSFAPYEGVYTVLPGITYTVQWRKGALQFMVTHQAFIPMFPDKEPDTFSFRALPAQVVFSREGGKVTGVTLKQDGHEFHGVRAQ